MFSSIITSRAKKEVFLVLCALSINMALFYDYYHAVLSQGASTVGHAWHIQAYSFYKHGLSNKLSNEDIRSKDFITYTVSDKPLEFTQSSIYDPIVFSALCAFIWRIFGSPNHIFLIVLNMLFFSFLIIFLFRAFEIMLKDSSKALSAALGTLFFLPLSFHNISNVRDVYHYYVFVIFLYFVLTFIFSSKRIIFLASGATAFVICQWARPVILSSFVILSMLFLLYGFLKPLYRRRTIEALSIFWMSSLLFFWIPFCTFNKITYDKYFLSALGENMLSSLYGTSLPNGDALEHSMAQFVLRKTGHVMACGSIESDDICMKLYKEYATRYPLHAVKCMLIRVKRMFWSDLVWRNYYFFEIKPGASKIVKLKILLADWSMLFEYVSRIYIRVLLLLGYLGIVLAYLRKEYLFANVMLFGVLFSSGYLWLFHMEQRVLAVHQWALGTFAFYALACMCEALFSLRNQKIIVTMQKDSELERVI